MEAVVAQKLLGRRAVEIPLETRLGSATAPECLSDADRGAPQVGMAQATMAGMPGASDDAGERAVDRPEGEER